MKVLGRYSLTAKVDPLNPVLLDLKPLIAAWVPERIRRIDRYIELCLVGGLHCIAGATLPKKTGVYLSSRCGAVGTSAKVMEHIFHDGDMPKPLHFVNTLGNSACFYLTRLLGTTGNTLVTSQEAFSFESALLHAWLDLQLGHIQHALVGGIDEVVLPLEKHAKRLNVNGEQTFTEGTHFLWLEKADLKSTGLQLSQPELCHTLKDLAAVLELLPSQTLFLTFVPNDQEQALLAGYQLILQQEINHYHSHGVAHGASLIEAIDLLDALQPTIIYLSKNQRSHYSVIRIRQNGLQ